MSARRHICDVPGCTNARKRWQRLCASCWPQLPADIRTGIADAFRIAASAIGGSTLKREARAEHHRLCAEARKHLDRTRDAMAERQRLAFANTERLLGEHS